MLTATYSPEDNKLRLSSVARLDDETYKRVRDAGFIWAPKQQIFVAPKWTPSREDLLLELCGEIDDEDTSLVDRAEMRAERFEGYQENRAKDARRAYTAVKELADGIPLGQPILVGHHSEKHARRDAQKIENGMRRAVKMWETSEYWQYRAAGAIRAAKYKERPDVRARRIKTLEAELRAEIAAYTERPGHARINQQRWTDPSDAPAIPHAWCGPAGRGGRWVAVEDLPKLEAGAKRWIAHYENRLTYERAMLAEGGGIKAETFDIQPGGRIKRRGEWLIVVKPNLREGKLISVSVLGHWAGTVPAEEVSDYQPPADGDAAKVAKATRKPPLCNFDAEGFKQMTMAEWKQATGWSCSTYVANFGADGQHTYGRVSQGEQAVLYRQRSVSGREHKRVPVFITDAPVVKPPKGEGYKPVSFEPVAREPREARQRPAEPEPPIPVDQLRESLKGGVKTISVNQLFPTPADVAARMVELADIREDDSILEPSAGTGAILRAIGPHASICAIEKQLNLCGVLRAVFPQVSVEDGDFMEMQPGSFDVILMNPPFQNGDDIKHIQHARKMLKPGGRLVAICANGPRQAEALMDKADTWEELPAGTFTGTNVRAVLLTMRHNQPEDTGYPPIAGKADREYSTRIDAQRCTLQFAQVSTKPLDTGKLPIEDSPLFGGDRQGDLFV